MIGGKIAGVAIGAFLTGSGTRTAIQAGMSLAQIGEFSFIIAVLGARLGATGEFLYPVTVGVSVVTSLATPWLIRAAGPAARTSTASCRGRCRPSRRSTARGWNGWRLRRMRRRRRGAG